MIRLGTYYRYLVSKTLDLPVSGKKILDVGCYDGFMLSHIDAIEKVGIDVNIIKKYPDIHYIERNFMKYNFNSKKFDKIFAFDIIEHVRDDKIFLEKIIQLLDANGTAILSTPSENIKIFPEVLQFWIDTKWKHIYRRGYNEKIIKELLRDCDKNIKLTIINWNCPMFRFFYLPLNFLWKLFPALAKALLNPINKFDSKLRNGKNGYIYIIIEHT